MIRPALLLSMALLAACGPAPLETYDGDEPSYQEPAEPAEPAPPEELPDAGSAPDAAPPPPEELPDAGRPDAAPDEPEDAGTPPDAGTEPPPPPPPPCQGPKEGSPVASVTLAPRSLTDSSGVVREGLAPAVRIAFAVPTPASSVTVTAWWRLPAGSRCAAQSQAAATSDAAGRLVATSASAALDPPVDSELGAQTHRVEVRVTNLDLPVAWLELSPDGGCLVPGPSELSALMSRGGDDWSASSPERVVVTAGGSVAWGCSP